MATDVSRKVPPVPEFGPHRQTNRPAQPVPATGGRQGHPGSPITLRGASCPDTCYDPARRVSPGVAPPLEGILHGCKSSQENAWNCKNNLKNNAQAKPETEGLVPE